MRALFCLVLSLLVACSATIVSGQVEPESAPAISTPEPASSPLPGSRTIRTFDFEETKLGNFESIPMFWSKVVGRGYPAYSSGGFDHSIYRSANSSFKLETNGGSVAYRLTPPPEQAIAIHPDSDYYILAFVRTSQLQHARADLTAWFADDQGKLIPATEVHSLPYNPAPTGMMESDDAWRVLYIFMPGPSEELPDTKSAATAPASHARSLVLQVGLMQPQQLDSTATVDSAKPGSIAAPGHSNLGKFEIYQQDIKGAVWFDDITIFQLPRVAVKVPKTALGNIFAANQKVTLDMVVSDLGAGSNDLNVRLRITDPEGLVFASEQWNALTSPEKAWTTQFSHSAFPAGLYTATLEVAQAGALAGGRSTDRALIARREAQFLCLPPESSAGDDRVAPEFGLGGSVYSGAGGGGESMAQAAVLWPSLLRDTGAGLLQFPAWRRDMSEQALERRDQPFDQLLAALQRLDVHTIGALSEIPESLAVRLPATAPYFDSHSILALLDADPALWRPTIAATLTLYANRIDSWELGAPDAPFSGNLPAPVGQAPDLADRYTRLYGRAYGEVAGLLSRPQLIVPWNALFDFDAKQFPNAILDLRLPAVIKPSQIPAYLDNFRQALVPAPIVVPAPTATQPAGRLPPIIPSAANPIYAHIDALESKRYSHADRIADFAQRIVFARTANPRAILYDPSVRMGGGNSGDVGQPDELLLVYRALIHALGNSVYVGELPVSPGVRAFLFNRNGSGTLVLWNESAGLPEIDLDLPLGATPRLTDLLGNPASVSLNTASGLSHLVVTRTPLILDLIDPRALQLKTSFAFSFTTLPAGVGSMRAELMLANPYADGITGILRIQPPKGWSTDPSALSIAIAPGATFRHAITIRYPFTENAGPKELDARLTLDRSPSVAAQELALAYPLAITSDKVQMEGFSQMLENGDIVIQQMITNISNAPLNAQAYAVLPNYPRQQHYVLALPPGQTSIKRFTFPASTFVQKGAASVSPAEIVAALAHQNATLGLRQNDGATLLTKTIPLE